MSGLSAAVSRWGWPLAVAAAAFTVAVGLPASDPDMWWHLASGRWMVEHGDALRVDVFSSTATGEPYALGEPLGQVTLYLAYSAGSWLGIAVLRATLVAVAAFAIMRVALRGAAPLVAAPLTVLALVLSKPTWTDRPQLFTLALFAVSLELCLAARAGSRGARTASVAVVAAWSSLHAGYALGIALLWIFAIDALLERRPAVGALAAAAAGTFLVSLDPAALSLLSAAGHVAAATRGIAEESPVDVLTPFGALFALFVAATLTLFLLRGGTLLGALVLVPMLWLALSAQRHVPLFGFAAVAFLAPSLGPAIPERPGGGMRGRIRAPSHPGRSPNRSSSARLGVGVTGALWLGALASIAGAPRAPDTRAYPAAASVALAASRGVLFNEYDWGGYLIWNVPERAVFIDGRLSPFASNGVLAAYQQAIHVLPGWRGVLDRWNVAQALVRPDRALAQALRDDGWSVRGEGPGYVLLERPR